MTNGQVPASAVIEHTETPETPAQVAELLADAAQESRPVRIVGGGGARSFGNSLRQVTWSLSTDRLDRILEYQPTDMTLSVQSGARLAEVGAALAEHGQMLPIEAPTPDIATIGGLLATGLTGPRRYGGGTLRDVLIGISVAYPDGTVGKAGGMVVKNVSGFDMMRIHYGAMGTLGVIVSANFKVLPLPRSEFTLVARYDALAPAAEAATAWRSSQFRPVAAIIRQADGAWQVVARYEGRESGLSAVRSRLASLAFQSSEILEGTGSAEFWATLMAGRRLDQPEEVRLRVSVAPTLATSIAQTIQAGAPAGIRFMRFEIEPGLGTTTLSVEAPTVEAARSFVKWLRLETKGGVAAIIAAPDPVKSGFDVWGQEPATIDIMRALKREFDPAGILNPGCYVGGI